jgi:poly-beta-1,6-N-acetyl-D-glucosamine synthase
LVSILFFINVIILCYFALIVLGSSFFSVISFPASLRKFKETEYGNIVNIMRQKEFLPVTIIVPMYNEQKRILNNVYSLLNSYYKNIEIILVNDGSTDDTFSILKAEFSLYEVPLIFKQILKTAPLQNCFKSRTYPNITVINKEHSRDSNAADSINVGINACRTPVHVTVDADTILEPEALSEIIFTFLSQPHCMAVGGAVYVLNENKVDRGVLLETNIPRRFIPAVQSVEYVRSFLYNRVAWNSLGGALSYAGAFTLFETQAVREVGGCDTTNSSYDMEIILRLRYKMQTNKYPCAVYYTPNAISWTEVPSTLKAYWKQRNYWQRGMLHGCFNYVGAFFNFRYGILGLFAFPFYLIFETFGTVVEFISYLLLLIALLIGAVDFKSIQWFFALAWGYILFLTMVSAFINTLTFRKYHRPFDIFRIFGLVSAEMIGFRQYRACCCFFATVQYFINRLKGRSQ